MDGLFEKLEEETKELQHGLEDFPAPGPRPHSQGIAGAGKPQISDALREHLEEEVGDLFFVLVNIARYLSLTPSRRSERPTENSSDAFSGWSNSYAAQVAARKMPP